MIIAALLAVASPPVLGGELYAYCTGIGWIDDSMAVIVDVRTGAGKVGEETLSVPPEVSSADLAVDFIEAVRASPELARLPAEKAVFMSLYGKYATRPRIR